jgi:hypothetical protein
MANGILAVQGHLHLDTSIAEIRLLTAMIVISFPIEITVEADRHLPETAIQMAMSVIAVMPVRNNIMIVHGRA